MKRAPVNVIKSGIFCRRRRIICLVSLVPLLFGTLTLGFLLDVFSYESLNFSEFHHAILNLPNKLSYLTSSNHLPFKYNGSIDGGFHKQPVLLNLTNFKWILNNPNLCQINSAEENTRLLPVLVHTARSHFEERLIIRKSYGSLKNYKEWIVKPVFLLGESEGKAEQEDKRLLAEHNIFGDIVMGNFVDSYHNLTYKHVMGYKWILNFCQNATFVLKTDDDIFVDILHWLDWITPDVEKVEQNLALTMPDIYCWVFKWVSPFRQINSKWYVSEEDWPDKYYPNYCSGWAYGITVGLIETLYSVVNDIKFFWIDDVFVTGALMEVAKTKYNFQPEVVSIWREVSGDIKDFRPFCDRKNYKDKRTFPSVVSVPRGRLFERDMICMWNKSLHDAIIS